MCVCEREMNENKNTMYHTQKKLHNIIYHTHENKKKERNTIYSKIRENIKKLKYYLDRYYVYTRYIIKFSIYIYIIIIIYIY